MNKVITSSAQQHRLPTELKAQSGNHKPLLDPTETTGGKPCKPPQVTE